MARFKILPSYTAEFMEDSEWVMARTKSRRPQTVVASLADCDVCQVGRDLCLLAIVSYHDPHRNMTGIKLAEYEGGKGEGAQLTKRLFPERVFVIKLTPALQTYPRKKRVQGSERVGFAWKSDCRDCSITYPSVVRGVEGFGTV